MDNESLSTQANETNPTQAPNPDQRSGLDQRFAEMTRKQYELQEKNQELQRQMIEAQAQQAEALQRLAQFQQKPAEIDPLASFREKVDPEVLNAMNAQMQAVTQRLQAEQAAKMQALELQSAVYQLRSDAAQLRGVPPEVAQRAEQLLIAWKRAGLSQVTSTDALDIALGQYQRGQLARANPVMQAQQSQAQFQYAPPVTPGAPPMAMMPPAPAQRSARPANFDELPRGQQNALLEKDGELDLPF